MKNFLLTLITIFLFSLRIFAQEEKGLPFEVKGFVDTYHAVRSSSPYDLMSSRTRVRGELEKHFGNSRLVVSFNATYNALLKDETGFRLREAFFEHRERNWALQAGRQLIIWGAADGVRITDLVSPLDMTEFLAQDYDDIRMPVNALRFSLFNETLRFETVLIPVFEGYKLPYRSDNPWSFLSSMPSLNVVWDDKTGTPAFKFANIEYGGRLNVTLPGIDFSLAALHTWNKMPVLEQVSPSPKELHITPRYYCMGFLGGDLSVPFGQFVMRGEAAFNIDKHFSYSRPASQRGFNTFNWLLGIDWYAPHDWMLSAQFSSENIFGYKDFIRQANNSLLLTLNISKKLFNNILQLSDFTYWDLTDRGWFSRFSADYALSDQIHLMAGYDWFGGEEGIFGTYKNNSEFWFKAKYSF
ncbi:hypothetical protein HQ47_09720 [Porphyromonas macacae]|uniref:Alginate export domain-containing protein n=1 Tax=Porphyromonas macacae TaxID=28115 RepID=A0A0A2E0R3_9PORP|nr:DUF1302 family protein [Porphyromonas macacae]KGN72498.1 hypothetical protein HQ47_09720 [Porphyromonas macacae]